MDINWQIGTSRVDITPARPQGIVMLGYSNVHNFIKGIETPINVRAICLENDKTKELFFFLNYELCFITESIRKGLCQRLSESKTIKNVAESNLMITAQHTHSAPSGYTEYALYNMPTGGHIPEILDLFVSKGMEAIESAYLKKSPGTLNFCKSKYDPTVEVAFNRSLEAYKKNPEVENQNVNTSQAVNREVYQLNILKDGKLSGIINWFGVHATSISNRHTLITPDNKGYASLYFEDYLKENKEGHESFAIFAQECCGDISPNFTPRKDDKNSNRGRYEDDFESARYNAGLQFVKAKELSQKDGQLPINASTFDSELIFVDMSKVEVDSEFLPKNAKSKTTAPGAFGASFPYGTSDGRGIPEALYLLLKNAIQIIWFIKRKLLSKWCLDQEDEKVYQAQYPKDIFVESGRKNVMGIKNVKFLPIPGMLDPIVKTMKIKAKKSALKENTWVQEVLPFQITFLGQLALVALPGEPSTMTGQRIRKILSPFFDQRAIKEMVLVPYANAYAGYMVTPEEYDAKCYEASHTLFGRNTTPAVQTILKSMAQEMLKPKEQRNLDRTLRPPSFSDSELKKRTKHFSIQNN